MVKNNLKSQHRQQFKYGGSILKKTLETNSLVLIGCCIYMPGDALLSSNLSPGQAWISGWHLCLVSSLPVSYSSPMMLLLQEINSQGPKVYTSSPLTFF
jgi:hypothetical protein